MPVFQIIAYYHAHFTNDGNLRSPLRLGDVCPMFGVELVRRSSILWLNRMGGGGAGTWEGELHCCPLQLQALRSLASLCASRFCPSSSGLRRPAHSCA